MPYIRTKLVKGKVYYYLVESFWEDGKPRQRVLLYLGKHETVQAAYRHWQGQIMDGKDAETRKRARAMVKKLALYL